MNDWNVIVTVRDGGFNRIRRLIEEFGPVSRTGFFNVLVLKANDTHRLMETVRERVMEDPKILTFLARMIPATRTFDFEGLEEFEAKAREILLSWTPELAGKELYVRIHRRGFKGQLSSVVEERALDDFVLANLETSGAPGRINYQNPDAVVTVETLGQRAGLSIWRRGDIERYPFLKIDGGLRIVSEMAATRWQEGENNGEKVKAGPWPSK